MMYLDLRLYSAADWLLFFYIYCFLGWCWESAYVSIKEKKWVDRGFMRGPYIPIYGTGAMIILVSTLPIQNYPVGVYFFGLFSATLLELVTGMAMEAIFKVRYWDYSGNKLNYKGYICLSSSVAWGFMSLLMVYIIHLPISDFVLLIPSMLRTVLAVLVTCVFCSDFVYSFKTAYDLRTMIMNNQYLMKELLAAQLKMEALEAILKEEGKAAVEKLADIQDFVSDRIETYVKNNRLSPEEIAEQLKRRGEILLEDMEYLNDVRKEKIHSELSEIRAKVKASQEKRRKEFSQGIQSLLRRNPSAVAGKYEGFIEGLRTNIEQLSTPQRLYNFLAEKLKK